MDFVESADVLKALGEVTRLKIVSLLAIRDCCVCELVPLFGVSQPAISKHMSRLKSVGLVSEARKGQWVFYSLKKKKLQELCVSLDHLPDMSRELAQLVNQEGLVCE